MCGNGEKFGDFQTGSSFENGAWCFIVAEYNAGKCYAYLNGNQKAELDINAVSDNGKALWIGDYAGEDITHFNGSYDECRLRGGTVSADWVKTEYDNVTDAEFLSYGPATVALRGLLFLVR